MRAANRGQPCPVADAAAEPARAADADGARMRRGRGVNVERRASIPGHAREFAGFVRRASAGHCVAAFRTSIGAIEI